MNYDKNNQLLSMMKPMGANYSFEYDNNVCDRVIRAISPTGVTNSIEYDSYGNPIRTKIHNKNVTLENIDSTKTYYIRGKGTNKYFFIKADKTVRMKQDECSYDKFYIIRTEDDKIKIKHAVLTDYYIKVAGNSIKLMYGDYDNLLDIYQNSNGSYTIGGIDVLTITDTFNVELERASDDNYQQQFYFESVEDGLYIKTSSTYTDDGRFIKTVTDALGNTSTYDINTTNGVINSITDPNNNTTNYTYDDKFRVTNISKGSHNVSYEYDTNNNLSKIIHGTKDYIFNYDEFNNTSNIKINNTTLVSNSYEPNNGNLSKVTYGNGHEISYTYDDNDRVKTITKGNETFIKYYDNLGRLVGISRDISIYQNSTFTYDFAKRLSKYTNGSYITEYEYDKESNVIEKIEQYGYRNYKYDYTYNKENALTNVSINNNNFKYIYDELSRVKETNINDNYKVSYHYITNLSKTSTIVDEVNDNGIIYSYKYDKLGNVTEIYKDNVLTNQYYYDEHSQLIKENNFITNQTIEYSYDNYGNILSNKIYEYDTTTLIDENIYEYNDSNWQDLLTKFNDEEITYDEIGNPLTMGNKVFTWKNGRELATYSDGSNNISYEYDVGGIRTSKTVNGIKTSYILEDSTDGV